MAPIVQNHFSVEVRRDHRAAIIVPRGELDLASAPELELELERAWRSDAELVIVDLRALEFMDSTGVHLLVRAHQRARELDRRMGIIDGREHVHVVLRLTGVLDMLNVAAAPGDLLDG